jgi:hypothetical protein
LSKEFLNFAEISKAVPFRDLLDLLNVSYTEKNGELYGDGFIVNISKNLFFVPKNDDIKGSPINFLAYYKSIELREAAAELKKQFLTKPKYPKKDIPNLTLEWDEYIQERGITPDVATEYEIGLVKQRSIVAGRIAFKVYDSAGKVAGYIGYKPEDNTWFYPKGFKRPLYNAQRLQDSKIAIVTVDPFDALKLVSLGFKQVASLLAKSMTEEQGEQLKKFKYILLLNNEPLNIVNRLYQTSFIKAPALSKPLKEMTNQEITDLIKP